MNNKLYIEAMDLVKEYLFDQVQSSLALHKTDKRLVFQMTNLDEFMHGVLSEIKPSFIPPLGVLQERHKGKPDEGIVRKVFDEVFNYYMTCKVGWAYVDANKLYNKTKARRR